MNVIAREERPKRSVFEESFSSCQLVNRPKTRYSMGFSVVFQERLSIKIFSQASKKFHTLQSLSFSK
jgi:hypothetical protein